MNQSPQKVPIQQSPVKMQPIINSPTKQQPEIIPTAPQSANNINNEDLLNQLYMQQNENQQLRIRLEQQIAYSNQQMQQMQQNYDRMALEAEQKKHNKPRSFKRSTAPFTEHTQTEGPIYSRC